MEIFRISQKKYSDQLTSSGSANRWNKRGQMVIYAGSSRSLSTLELVVNKSSVISSDVYKVIVISIPDDDKFIRQIKLKDLPADWRNMSGYSNLQEIGSNWYNSRETLVLKVPSAVIPMEHNYVINSEHKDFIKKIKLVRTEDYFGDKRHL